MDIDSLLRRSTATQAGASFGHARSPAARCCGWPVPQITTISTATAAPVIAERSYGAASRLRARCRIPAQAGDHHRESDQPDAPILVRGDSMFGTKKVITTCIQRGAEFSCRSAATSASTPRSPPSTRRLDPVHYPARRRPDTGVDLRCQVAETPTPCAWPAAEH
ncbi:transposase, IS4 family [Mycobacterium xenopi 4042]|uniref:Transposase, IS4 family n=1 Tax=Mycobacterium xenopi 4042 TaxID=1299334 RepID=X8BLL6_MYCXE|nr:transposase, IS4 family [Mycobacterium xenopi 4042]